VAKALFFQNVTWNCLLQSNKNLLRL